jgi:multidrug efflux pump subunit AcrA (membrane-fusion protein)
MSQIYVVSADGTVHVRTVQLGAQIGPKIIITSGLSGGETVVTEGLDKLKDGMKVSTQPDTATAAPAAPQGN